MTEPLRLWVAVEAIKPLTFRIDHYGQTVRLIAVPDLDGAGPALLCRHEDTVLFAQQLDGAQLHLGALTGSEAFQDSVQSALLACRVVGQGLATWAEIYDDAKQPQDAPEHVLFPAPTSGPSAAELARLEAIAARLEATT
jgi:hypothetical protein